MAKKSNLLLSVFISLIFIPSIIGQFNFPFNHLNGKKITTDGYYDFFYQDSEGFIWIGSLNGTSRFDGQIVKKILTPKYVTTSDFYEDKNQDLWFSTTNELVKYHRNTDSLEIFQLVNSNCDTVTNGYYIFHLSESNIWLKIDNEITHFDTQNKEQIFFPFLTKGMRFLMAYDSINIPKNIYTTPWRKQSGIEKLQLNPREEQYTFSQFETNLGIVDTFKVRHLLRQDSTLWFCTNSGLVELNENNLQKAILHNTLGKLDIWNAVLLNDSLIITSSLGDGLHLFNTKTKVFNKAEVKNLSSNSPRRLYLDDDKTLWVAHRQKGIDFAPIIPMITSINPLEEQNANIWFISENKNGFIWIATERKGIFVFNSEHQIVAKYPYNQVDEIKENQINNLTCDANGDIWCVTDHHIYKYEQEHWQQKIQSKVNFFFISFLKNGQAFVSTSEGIQELILEGEKAVLEYNHLPFKGKGIRYGRIFEDSKKHIYLHKIDTLHIYKQQAGKFIEQAAHSLKADLISFAEDSLRNCVWLGTSNGLFQLSNTDFQIKKVTLRKFWDANPLSINGVLAEKDALWLSTYRGLIHYDINTEETYSIREEEGLSDESFSLYAYHKDSNDKMWFGNAKGLTVFDPKEQNLTPRTPNPYLDKVTINNKAVDKSDWMQEEYPVTLSYKENTLEFNLLAVGTHLAKYNKVYYRLKNYDNRWVETTNKQVVRYAQLSPNDYILEYFAVGANGIESKTKRAKFRISPPFWQTWWFRLLALLIVFASTYLSIQAYVRAKTREEREKLKRQFAIQAERERIGSELHDDVASNLAVIKAISDTALPESDTAKNDFLDISAYAQESYESMKDIVWALNPENAPIVNLLGRVRKFTHDLFHAHQTTYILDIADDIPNLMLGSQVRKNAYLIVKEALHNVLKYAEAEQVTVEIDMKGESLLIAIKDNGAGFDPNDKKSGQGLRNMQKRANEIEAAFSINSIPKEGTSITLLITDFGYD